MADARFAEAIARIDAVNARDPRGYELPYAERLSAWVDRLDPDASEELRLAARAQHIAARALWFSALAQLARDTGTASPTLKTAIAVTEEPNHP